MVFLNSGYFWVGIGGAIGAMARVFLTNLLPQSLYNFPLRILLVNCIGCFAAGVLVEMMALHWHTSVNTRHFLIQGLLGGFTTFSAFAIEAGLFFQKGAFFSGIAYSLLSVASGILFLFIGLRLTRVIF